MTARAPKSWKPFTSDTIMDSKKLKNDSLKTIYKVVSDLTAICMDYSHFCGKPEIDLFDIMERISTADAELNRIRDVINCFLSDPGRQ